MEIRLISFQLVLFALAVNLATCDEISFENLKKQLFSNDAPILPKEKVLELLKLIKPLTPEKSDKIDIVDQLEIDELIEIDNLLNDENSCLDKKFFEQIPLDRSELDRFRTIDFNQVIDWNKNIDNYISESLIEKFTPCSKKFIESVNSQQDGVKFANLIDENFDKDGKHHLVYEINVATKKLLSKDLPEKNSKPKPTKKLIEEKVMNYYSKISLACDNMINNVKHYQLMLQAFDNYFDVLKLNKNDELLKAIRQMQICNIVHRGAHPNDHHKFNKNFDRETAGQWALGEILKDY